MDEDAPAPVPVPDEDPLKRDKQLRLLLNAMLTVAGLAMIAALLGTVGLLPLGGLAVELAMMGGAALLLIGAGAVFNQVHWKPLRAAAGQRMQQRARSDVQLTIVSIFGLFTFLFAIGLEIGAVLFIFNVVQVQGILGRQETFVLFQMIILLVYLMALIVRQGNASHYRPADATKTVAWVLTGLAGVLILVGILFAFQIIPAFANLAESSWQATHAITLGVGLEALAMRIRLRLPSLWSQFREAVTAARVANEDIRREMQTRARWTYIGAFVFVAASMGFTALLATGAVQLQSRQATLGLVIFYGGIGAIILGLVTLRVVQSAMIDKRKADEHLDPLERLASQKQADPQEVFRRAVYMATGTFAFLCIVAAVLVAFERIPGIEKKFYTDLGLLGIVLATGPYGFFYNQDMKRIEAIDEKFPDLLRDIAESARAGMTLPRALVTAAKGTYGALTPDVKKMAAQVEWGVAFSDALERFAGRVKTPLIDRTVALVVEASRAGGNVVDILTAASDDAREIKQIISERNEQMKMYQVVVFIAFFVFIAVVLILSAQFIPAFKEAVGPASGQQVGGLKFQDFEVEDFNTLFFHAAVVQAIGGGLVGGVLTRGQPMAGAFSILFMIIAAWVSFRLLLGVM